MKKALRAMGFELQRFDPDGSYAKRRQRLLESEAVDLVIDVGAHAGEFAGSVRHGGYWERIVSFEPQTLMFERLKRACDDDPLWECQQRAIGKAPGSVELHISGNDGFSSSLRPMAVVHQTAEPSSSYVSSETVEIVRLDEAMENTLDTARSLMLKIDTQGYESEVLAGAEETLERCSLVELELVLVELYRGQALFSDLVVQMDRSGFVLTDVESGFRDPRNSQLLQIDGLFVRDSNI